MKNTEPRTCAVWLCVLSDKQDSLRVFAQEFVDQKLVRVFILF